MLTLIDTGNKPFLFLVIAHKSEGVVQQAKCYSIQ